jgi:hypothetical protein
MRARVVRKGGARRLLPHPGRHRQQVPRGDQIEKVSPVGGGRETVLGEGEVQVDQAVGVGDADLIEGRRGRGDVGSQDVCGRTVVIGVGRGGVRAEGEGVEVRRPNKL